MKASTYIIAELSANHGQDLDIALASVRAAKAAGADAIKIQTYTADTITLDCDSKDFQVKSGTIWDGMTLYQLYQQAYTPWEWHQAIFDEAKNVGIECFSTPFDKSAVDFLETLGNPIYKIASFEITDIPLIEYAASKQKPMIISTGVATPEDIQLAIDTCHKVGNNDITLLHCVSAYPAPLDDVNLLTMKDMGKRYGVKVGLSDHTLGSDVAIASAALGASVIEKHFILDRSIGGPDAAFSMQQDEFFSMVQSIRNVEKALGIVKYKDNPSQIPGREFSRSLYVAEDINEGEMVTEKNVRPVRPGYGLHPKYYNEILGKKVRVKLKKGDRVTLDNIFEHDV